MDIQKAKQVRRSRRKTGIRKRVVGKPDRPRLSVFRSRKHIYVQVVDDMAGTTLVAASTRDKGFNAENTGNVAAAQAVGTLLGERAKEAGISKVTFDRGGFRYHGRVKALADAARKAGLDF